MEGIGECVMRASLASLSARVRAASIHPARGVGVRVCSTARRPTSRATAADDEPPASSSPAADRVSSGEGARSWERFYRTHVGKGADPSAKPIRAFKDRHYLRREFAELMPQSIRDDPKAHTPPLDPSALPPPDVDSPDHKVVLELGCGVGNSAFPMMRANPDMFVHACDCSETAIANLRASPEFDPKRCDAFVADLAADDSPLAEKIGDGTCDAVTGVFFFSALDSRTFGHVAAECWRVLKPGGSVLFRDYGLDDVKNAGGTKGATRGEIRGAEFEPGRQIEDATYVRPDGTLAVFLDEARVEGVFGKVGLEGECRRVTHEVVNRKLDVRITRSFVQGRFEKKAAA